MSNFNYEFFLVKDNDPECLTIEMIDRRRDPDGCVLADEESFNDEMPMYFTEHGHFVSAVYILNEIRRNMSDRFPDVRFKASMLAQYTIINMEDMEVVWENLDVKVVQCYDGKKTGEHLVHADSPDMYNSLDEFVEMMVERCMGAGYEAPDGEDDEEDDLYDFDDDEFFKNDDDEHSPDYDEDDDFEDLPFGNEELPLALRKDDFKSSDFFESNRPMPSFKQIMKEIGMDELEGLDDVKAEFENIYCLCRLQRMRARKHVKSRKALDRFHFIFTGNPGTGKTTVAQMLGKMFQRMGLLSEGDVHTHTRTDLVQGYIGATEKHMTKIIREARGGILFIDEAYALFDGRDDRADFGHMVLQALLPVLTEDDPNLVVILAGYPEEMNKMLDSNPGLRSRFPFNLHFEDYTPEQLTNIGLRKLSAYAFSAGEEESRLFGQEVKKCWENRDPRNFANARFIDNAVYYIVLAVAKRLSLQSVSRLSKRALSHVTVEDIESGFANFHRQQQRSGSKKRQIGFAFSRS